jgi:hypothetical protein
MKMTKRHADAFAHELALARTLEQEGRMDGALHHLERAHVLGQRHVVPHVVVLWRMLRIEVRRRRAAASWGQLVRIVLGGLGSAVGKVPVGNTGGSDIGMFEELPIDADLAELMRERAGPLA